LVTLLLPPHAADRIVAASMTKCSAHFLRRFSSKPVTRTHPNNPSGSHAAQKLPARSNDGGVNAAVRFAAFTVSVAVFPGVTDPGEMPHVGVGIGPLTEHASAIVPEKPPCAGNVKTSLT